MQTFDEATSDQTLAAVERDVVRGLSAAPKWLPPWLFYDEAGSRLFETITLLPEYYLTRKEREILASCATVAIKIASGPSRLTIVEPGAGTAAKTGLLLGAAVAIQGYILYQPIDVSATALKAAQASIEASIPGVRVHTRVANYANGSFEFYRQSDERILVLLLGSSIGNFSPAEARALLGAIHRRLRPGDHILLGTDLVKSEDKLVAAYDDAAGVTAAFNLNVLARINRDLGANFDLECFRHEARWNHTESRMEMHLVSTCQQYVEICLRNGRGQFVTHMATGESIHTENSYKFTLQGIQILLESGGFTVRRMWQDPEFMFLVTLAEAF